MRIDQIILRPSANLIVLQHSDRAGRTGAVLIDPGSLNETQTGSLATLVDLCQSRLPLEPDKPPPVGSRARDRGPRIPPRITAEADTVRDPSTARKSVVNPVKSYAPAPGNIPANNTALLRLLSVATNFTSVSARYSLQP